MLCSLQSGLADAPSQSIMENESGNLEPPPGSIDSEVEQIAEKACCAGGLTEVVEERVNTIKVDQEAIDEKLILIEQEPVHLDGEVQPVDEEPQLVDREHESAKIEHFTTRTEELQTESESQDPKQESEIVNAKPAPLEETLKTVSPEQQQQQVDKELLAANENSTTTSSNDLKIPTPIPIEHNTEKATTTTTSTNSINSKTEVEKKKDDDKLAMYKALAIKLKKDLVKNREELKKLREDSQQESISLNERLNNLEAKLDTERQSNSQTITALDLKVKDLKQQLLDSEEELQLLQGDFENYKVKASQIMQQNGVTISSTCKSFQEERYKQLKELNEVQKRQVSNLESQLSTTLDKNQDLVREMKLLQDQSEELKKKVETSKSLETKCEALTRENENLKIALKQFRIKFKEPDETRGPNQTCDITSDGKSYDKEVTKTTDRLSLNDPEDRTEESSRGLSPSTSVKDGYQTNSNSSFDGSTSGYVHIKQSAFEIINRTSGLDDGQNSVEGLKKVYLDSERTNSLLTDQVKALKEEIRRLQRGTDRLELAENLEYLKNVVYKFVSLDSSQFEQKQRLVPVLSTVLKLSPEETAKLNSIAISDKPSLTTSFFKL